MGKRIGQATGLLLLAVAVFVLSTAALKPRADVGGASINRRGELIASNDKPFPVLSASKVIPAAMALERGDRALLPLIRLSVIDSNNQAADQLTARLGGKSSVQKWLAAKHLPSAFATEAEMIADPTVYQLRPSELALILDRIRSPELVALMRQTRTGNDRIRAAFPGAPHKSGTAGDYLADVGFVGEQTVVVMGRGVEAKDLSAVALSFSEMRRSVE